MPDNNLLNAIQSDWVSLLTSIVLIGVLYGLARRKVSFGVRVLIALGLGLAAGIFFNRGHHDATSVATIGTSTSTKTPISIGLTNSHPASVSPRFREPPARRAAVRAEAPVCGTIACLAMSNTSTSFAWWSHYKKNRVIRFNGILINFALILTLCAPRPRGRERPDF